MPVTIVAGAQWGDEGKGRIVDLLAEKAELVVRCQGGPNAGHTVINDRGRFVLHAVPSGIFSDSARCIIAAGTVLNPSGLVEELQGLAAAGIDIQRLLVSERASLIMPYHRLIERLDEQVRTPESRVAPTGQGIAPAYADKASRIGLRAGDLLDMSVFRSRLSDALGRVNRILAGYGHPPVSVQEVLEEVEPAADFLRPYIGDTVGPITSAVADNAEILLEGQLGVMRDLDWGAYPFVTSSSPTPAGMTAAAGIPPTAVARVIGVAKAYTTAVGAGPFPTELHGIRGDELRQRGGEYGATTGRPRRCGWFDAVAVAWACRVAGFTELALTKLDVLDGEPTLSVCVEYRADGTELQAFPTTQLMQRVEPVYQDLPGWSDTTSGARTTAELPADAGNYVDYLERRVGVPVTFISVGPERDSIIFRDAHSARAC